MKQLPGRAAAGIAGALAAWLGLPATGLADPLPVERLRLPPGYTVELWARADNARAMTVGENTLFVGSMAAGRVYAIPFDPDTHAAGPVRVIAEGLPRPVGVAWRDGALFVSAIDRILRIDDAAGPEPGSPEPLPQRFPDDEHHGWKFIAFGPDGGLYVPVGAPCNVCKADPHRYAGIWRIDVDGDGIRRWATGVRNTVGFDWQPGSGVLWFTDNGRDWLGDDEPPDELNRAPRPGLDFGFPACHGRDLPDPEFGSGTACKGMTPPALELGAHVAPLGMRFYRGRQFPESWRGDIILAEHGSWNRSTPAGYLVRRVRVNGSRVAGSEVFIDGWLDEDGRAWGRPVDVQELPDGSLLVSDDLAGAIWRVRHQKSPAADGKPRPGKEGP